MKNTSLCLLIITAAISFQAAAQTTLTLEESKHRALQNNCKIKNGALELEAARQTRMAALTSYFPMISAGGAMFGAEKNLMEISTQGGNLPVYNGNPATLVTATQFAYMPASSMGLMKKGTFGMVSAVQPLFAGGRIINGNRLAALGVEVGERRYELSKNEVMLKTEELYWLIVSLAEKRKTVQMYEDLLTSLQRQVEAAYASGLVMKNDVLKVKLKRSEVQMNKAKLENGRALAMMAFCQHIGAAYDTSIVLIDTLGLQEIPELFFVDHNDALKKRNEYHLLQASVNAEEMQTSMKLGEYLPQAAVGVAGLYMKLDEAKDRRVGVLFGTVQIPISGWWAASHTLQERSAKEEIARNSFKDNTELLLLQMQKTWKDLQDAYTQVLLNEESEVQAGENFKTSDDSYRNGLINLSDLLEAQVALQQSRDHVTDAKADYRNKIFAYLQATGR